MNNTIKFTVAGLAITSVLSTPFEADAMTNQQMKLVGISTLRILSIRNQKEVVEIIKEGTVVEVIKEMEKQEGWYYVKTPSGKKGVCSGLYLRSVGNQAQSNGENIYYTKSNLNLRKGIGTSYGILKTIPKGAKVTKLSESNGWAKVTYNGLTGFCSGEYLTKKSSAVSNSTATTYYVNTNFLNVRTGPSTSYSVYKKIYRNTLVKVTKTRNDGWSEININNKTYYVSSQYLSKKVDSDSTNSSTAIQYVNTNILNIRMGPNTSSTIYKKVGRGESVNVIEKRKDGWTKIRMDKKDLYVSSEYLTSVKPSSNTNISSPNVYAYSYTATTPTSQSSDNSIKNVQNAFKKIDGKILKPGETFSYLKAIGPITKTNGFVESGIISGGKYSTGVGGGICQGSSTIHNAVVKAGLTVEERRSHSLPSKYISKGLDAMVTEDLDYRFKNTSSYPVRIRAYVSDGQVVVRLESTGDTTNGYKFLPKVMVSSDGLKAITRVVKIKNGIEYLHQTFYSSYKSA